MMNNKILLGVVIAAAIVVVLIIAGGRSDKETSPTPTVSASASVSPTASPLATGTAKTLTYAEALKKYSGVRIQFDARCQAIPSQLTIKKGAVVMLDNRSGDGRTISVGTVKYYLPGYGFRIVAPTSKMVPGTVLIDCGSAQNVGQILIQK